MDLGLRNRVALVAASSQGLGLATAEAFAAEGCRVAMCARNQQALAANAERIRKQHKVEVFTDAFDVTDAGAVQRFVAAVVQKFGTVDICVTNAGGPPAKGFLAASLEDWQKAINANFLSTVYFAREVIPHFKGRFAAPRTSHEWATRKRGEIFGRAGQAILNSITSHVEEKASGVGSNGDEEPAPTAGERA